MRCSLRNTGYVFESPLAGCGNAIAGSGRKDRTVLIGGRLCVTSLRPLRHSAAQSARQFGAVLPFRGVSARSSVPGASVRTIRCAHAALPSGGSLQCGRPVHFSWRTSVHETMDSSDDGGGRRRATSRKRHSTEKAAAAAAAAVSDEDSESDGGEYDLSDLDDDGGCGGRWSKDEDNSLRRGVENLGAKNWKQISEEYLGNKR
jgi:hypothetical protein